MLAPLTGGPDRPAATASANEVPHSPQNLAVGLFTVPQAGQPELSLAPHSVQNFRPASFSVEQFGQITGSSRATWPSAER